MIQSAKRLSNISALKVCALGGVMIDPVAKVMIEEKFVIGGQSHHLSHQQIRDPTTARSVMTGLRYVESDFQATLLHPSLSAFLKFVQNRISHQSTQRLYQLPFEAAIPTCRSNDGLLDQGARESKLSLTRQSSIVDRSVRIIQQPSLRDLPEVISQNVVNILMTCEPFCNGLCFRV
jgi:hypothetical protein